MTYDNIITLSAEDIVLEKQQRGRDQIDPIQSFKG